MKVSLYVRPAYNKRIAADWPVPPRLFDRPVGLESYRDVISFMELGDRLGFDWVSFSEHHYNNGLMTPNPLLLASHMVDRLTHARIALLGPIVPILNPVRLAEELALLDNLSGGRIIVGFLRGTPTEFQTYGTNPGESKARFLEGAELILRAWTEPEPFGWQGRHFQYRQVSVWPPPQQHPHPPVYILASSPEACAFAARHRCGLGFSHDAFDTLAPSAAYYREQCARAGWTPEPDHVIYRGTGYLTSTRHEAEEFLATVPQRGPARPHPSVAAAVGALDASPRDPFTGFIDPKTRAPIPFLGTPEMILDEFARCREVLGAGVIDLTFAGRDQADMRANAARFADQVLPRAHAI